MNSNLVQHNLCSPVLSFVSICCNPLLDAAPSQIHAHYELKKSSRHKRNLAITGGVALSIITAPVVAAVSVGEKRKEKQQFINAAYRVQHAQSLKEEAGSEKEKLNFVEVNSV